MSEIDDKSVTSDLFFKVEIPTAGRLELLLARIFGEKVVTGDSGWEVTIHYWLSKMYITDCKKLGTHNTELKDNGRE